MEYYRRLKMKILWKIEDEEYYGRLKIWNIIED